MSSSLNLNVLIIEADTERCRGIADALGTLGVTKIQQTQHFRNIAKIMGNLPCDLILLGSHFVDASVEEALNFIQNHPETKHIPCIWISDAADPARSRELISQGIVDVVHYPVQPAALQSALRNFFRIVNGREIGKLIRKASFFKEFTKDELQTLVKVANARRFQAGEVILSKGDPADKFYVLLKGKVEVVSTKSGVMPDHITIHEGTPFGEMAVIDDSPRSAYCIAADDCLVLEIGSHIIFDTNFDLRLRVLASLALVLSSRIRQMNARFSALQQKLKAAPGIDEGVIAGSNEGSDDFSESEASPPPMTPKELEGPPREQLPMADMCTLAIRTQEEYDVLVRKIALRIEYIASRIPNAVVEVACNQLVESWSHQSQGRYHPLHWWDPETPPDVQRRLRQDLHLVVFAPHGEEAYSQCFLGLPLTHRVLTPPQASCTGTFLGSEESIRRYLAGHWPKSAIHLDLEMPINRIFSGQKTIEYLRHTVDDVRAQTLFLVFDGEDGRYTRLVREKFPYHQILTVVEGYGFDPHNLPSFFKTPSAQLEGKSLLVQREDYTSMGFYFGQALHFPDLSHYYAYTEVLSRWGYLFGTISLLAQIGPDMTGMGWGPRGDNADILKAAKNYQLNASLTPQQIASAIETADKNFKS